jgi:hypothetical protein
VRFKSLSTLLSGPDPGSGLLRCDVADWHFASFRCAAKFGRYRMHSGHHAVIAGRPTRLKLLAHGQGDDEHVAVLKRDKHVP